MELSRGKSLAAVVGVYIVALIAGLSVYILWEGAWPLRLLLADVVATLVVFVFSCVMGNASVYDPYWSVQPPAIVAAFAIGMGSGSAGLYTLILLIAWSVRLTGNWTTNFTGFGTYEDWRYKMLRARTGGLYPLVELLGIHLAPTLIVYACTLPAVAMTVEKLPLNAGALIFLSLGYASVLLELAADMRMNSFRRRRRKKSPFLRRGVWKYARHPNYLGEIAFWWSVGLAGVCLMPQRWYLLGGAVLVTVMFFTASIPMAERHLSEKPGFEAYRAETRLLLPIPKRK